MYYFFFYIFKEIIGIDKMTINFIGYKALSA